MRLRNFFLRLLVNAIALGLTAAALPGISVRGGIGTLLIVALIFGVINALLKPIIIVLTLPFTIITLGLFIFIINGLMLMLTAELSGGRIVVDGLWWAVLGGIVMGVISMIVEAMFKAFGWSEEKRERRSD